MNILQVPVRFYPYVGGVEQVVYYLSKELIRLGHQVTVLCANEPAVGSATVDQICVKRLRSIGKISNTNITPMLPLALLRERCDIIHTHLPVPWSADWPWVIASLKKVPLVLTYNNDIIGVSSLGVFFSKLYNTLFLPFLLRAARRIIITQKNYLNTSRFLKDYAQKVVVIPCGVDTEEFRPKARSEKSRESTIFFLSLLDELHRYKGLDYLIRALPVAKKYIPDLKLIVGGEGALKGEYERLARELGIASNVDFVGFIHRDQLVDYYNMCNVFVLPSITIQEGFGIVLLEAMACAKPVITTPIVGPADKIREWGVGRIVQPRDVEALASAIVDMVSDRGRVQAMGEKARQLIEQEYSWRIVAQQTVALYDEVLRDCNVKGC